MCLECTIYLHVVVCVSLQGIRSNDKINDDQIPVSGLYNCLVGKVDHDYLLLNGCDMEEERLNTLKKEPQIENRDIFE